MRFPAIMEAAATKRGRNLLRFRATNTKIASKAPSPIAIGRTSEAAPRSTPAMTYGAAFEDRQILWLHTPSVPDRDAPIVLVAAASIKGVISVGRLAPPKRSARDLAPLWTAYEVQGDDAVCSDTTCSPGLSASWSRCQCHDVGPPP